LDKNDSKIAAIGNGCASAECIKALRENGFDGEIHLFTDSSWPAYNPMLTTYYAAGKISFDRLFPYGTGNQFYREYKVKMHQSSPVVALDALKKIVTNQAGLELKYDKCLIASGASPFMPSIAGMDSDKIYLMRTVEDAIRLKEAISKKPKKALVIGASMIGIKLVELFYQAGIEVCLVDVADRIFPLIAHPECSCVIHDRLVKSGIRCKFGMNVERVEESPGGIRAYFKDSDESEEADLLAMCIGVRPNIAFVNRSQVEIKQGILVDECMRTSAQDVFAAGDVTQGKNLLTGMPQIIGLWANARYQGRTAGKNMAGIAETFPGSIPYNIVHFMGMDFIGIGDTCDYDRTEQKSDGERFIQLFWKNNLLTGANLVDTYTESGVIKNVLVKGLLSYKSDYFSSLPAIQNLLIKKVLQEVEKA
jgi:NAD(P)H-nitrite reductase large subunit